MRFHYVQSLNDFNLLSVLTLNLHNNTFKFKLFCYQFLKSVEHT